MGNKWKKTVAMGLVLTTSLGLAACGSSTTGASADKSKDEVVKPDQIKVMADGTVVTEPNGAEEFYAQLKDATGVDVEWIRPDHSGYYDAVANAFNDESSIPDVVILSSDYYALYAASGMLWNMSDAWKESDIESRLVDSAKNIYQTYQVKGDDGEDGLYGLCPVATGAGCCTYVKEEWLKQAGYQRSDIEDKTLTFDEYYTMLKKMHEATGKTVLSASGYVGKDAPYTNYLPEFYQQAKFSFYKDASGKYVDGFSEQAMKDALERIKTGVADGIIDKESINNSTADVRNKFYADNTGVFTYWYGTWAKTLKDTCADKDLGDLIAIKPIKELGSYSMRVEPVFAITSNAKNPEGIFEYWLSKMVDGGEVQRLWTYGAKGTHWDDKAETVTLEGKEDQPDTYEEGQFHFLPSPEKPTGYMQKNYVDPGSGITKLEIGDPAYDAMSDVIKDNKKFFLANCEPSTIIPMTDEYGDNISDINKARNLAVANVVTGEMSADEAIKDYNDKVGSLVKIVQDSLNKLDGTK